MDLNVILRFVCLFLNDNYRLVFMMNTKSAASSMESFLLSKDGFETNHITLRWWLEYFLLFFPQRFFETAENDLFSISKDMLILILI